MLNRLSKEILLKIIECMELVDIKSIVNIRITCRYLYVILTNKEIIDVFWDKQKGVYQCCQLCKIFTNQNQIFKKCLNDYCLDNNQQQDLFFKLLKLCPQLQKGIIDVFWDKKKPIYLCNELCIYLPNSF